MLYLGFKVLHLLGVVMFLGNITTGIFWKEHADRSRDPRIIAHAIAGIVATDRLLGGHRRIAQRCILDLAARESLHPDPHHAESASSRHTRSRPCERSPSHDEVRQFGERAREHILQRYSWDNVAETTAQLYEAVTGRKRGTTR